VNLVIPARAALADLLGEKPPWRFPVFVFERRLAYLVR